MIPKPEHGASDCMANTDMSSQSETKFTRNQEGTEKRKKPDCTIQQKKWKTLQKKQGTLCK